MQNNNPPLQEGYPFQNNYSSGLPNQIFNKKQQPAGDSSILFTQNSAPVATPFLPVSNVQSQSQPPALISGAPGQAANPFRAGTKKKAFSAAPPASTLFGAPLDSKTSFFDSLSNQPPPFQIQSQQPINSVTTNFPTIPNDSFSSYNQNQNLPKATSSNLQQGYSQTPPANFEWNSTESALPRNNSSAHAAVVPSFEAESVGFTQPENIQESHYNPFNTNNLTETENFAVSSELVAGTDISYPHQSYVQPKLFENEEFVEYNHQNYLEPPLQEFEEIDTDNQPLGTILTNKEYANHNVDTNVAAEVVPDNDLDDLVLGGMQNNQQWQPNYQTNYNSGYAYEGEQFINDEAQNSNYGQNNFENNQNFQQINGDFNQLAQSSYFDNNNANLAQNVVQNNNYEVNYSTEPNDSQQSQQNQLFQAYHQAQPITSPNNSNILEATVICPECSRRNDSEANFCNKCGSPLSMISPEPAKIQPQFYSQNPEESSNFSPQFVPNQSQFYPQQSQEISQNFYQQSSPIQPAFPISGSGFPPPPNAEISPFLKSKNVFQQRGVASPRQQHRNQMANSVQSDTSYGNTYQSVTTSVPQQNYSPYEIDFLQKSRGHAIVSFGFGKLVVTMPKRQNRFVTSANGTQTSVEKSYPGKVSVVGVKTVIFNYGEIQNEKRQIESFSGPLLKLKKKDVQKILEERSKLTDISKENVNLTWKVLKLLVENDGYLLNSPTAKANTASLTSLREILNITDVKSSSFVSTQLDDIEALLLAGDRSGACDAAIAKQLWSHALIISSNVDQEKYNDVVLKYLRSHFGTDAAGTVDNSIEVRPALQVLYGLFGGLGRTAVLETGIDLSIVEKWKEVLGIILSNRTASDAIAISALGDILIQQGMLESAHICYLLSLSHSIFSGADTPNARFVLLNADHSSQPMNFHKQITSLQMTEIFEFSQTLIPTYSGGASSLIGNSTAGISNIVPHLQAFKLSYAMYLADFGYFEQATKYCESIEIIVKSYTRGSPYFHRVFLERLRDLSERLATSISEKTKETSNGWFTNVAKYNSLFDVLDRGLNNFMNGAIGEQDIAKPTPITSSSNILSANMGGIDHSLEPPVVMAPTGSGFGNSITVAAIAAVNLLQRPKSTPATIESLPPKTSGNEHLELMSASPIPVPGPRLKNGTSASPGLLYQGNIHSDQQNASVRQQFNSQVEPGNLEIADQYISQLQESKSGQRFENQPQNNVNEFIQSDPNVQYQAFDQTYDQSYNYVDPSMYDQSYYGTQAFDGSNEAYVNQINLNANAQFQGHNVIPQEQGQQLIDQNYYSNEQYSQKYEDQNQYDLYANAEVQEVQYDQYQNDSYSYENQHALNQQFSNQQKPYDSYNSQVYENQKINSEQFADEQNQYGSFNYTQVQDNLQNQTTILQSNEVQQNQHNYDSYTSESQPQDQRNFQQNNSAQYSQHEQQNQVNWTGSYAIQNQVSSQNGQQSQESASHQSLNGPPSQQPIITPAQFSITPPSQQSIAPPKQSTAQQSQQSLVLPPVQSIAEPFQQSIAPPPQQSIAPLTQQSIAPPPSLIQNEEKVEDLGFGNPKKKEKKKCKFSTGYLKYRIVWNKFQGLTSFCLIFR
ncbi:hypothetical protein HK096_002338 [Nowakowskiella sp. JEL0078]|nr:hypothetical protein HK096_002338 [Nowakowskiella sp. JEL0078]